MTEPEFLHFPAYSGPGEPGFYRDFLGVRTRIDYVHLPAYASGHVFGYPRRGEVFLHYQDEWLGLLRSVIEAQDRLVAVELGAGWGPWLVAAAVGARQRGIDSVRLVGIEGMADHLTFMRQHFADNGLVPDDHKLIHGVVGPQDGMAHFPVAADATVDWGSAASFNGPGPNTVPVRSVSLPTLLADLDRVDLLHCDIQGAEADILSAAMPDLTRAVRRVVVGTHSRGIEDRLFTAFRAAGWWLENETACTYKIEDGQNYLADDGTQLWENPTNRMR